MSDIIEKISAILPGASFEPDQDQAPKFSISNAAPEGVWSTLCTTKGVLSITGEQRLKFLQGQATCDTAEITQTTSCYGAFCNLKGRAIANFLAFDDGESTHLIMHQSLIPNLIEHLTKFAVFFRVTLNHDQNAVILGHHSDSPSESTNLPTVQNDQGTDIQVSPFRRLSILSPEQLNPASVSVWANETHWNQADLRDGICWISANTREEFLPQLLGLEEIGGLSFSKGCYTGQEIIARMKYRGQLKRHLQLATLTSTEPPQISELLAAKINTDEKNNIGQIINFETTEEGLLALISLEDDFKTINQCSIGQNAFEIKLMALNDH